MLQETIEDIDKNGDGKIDLQEYIGKLRQCFPGEKKHTLELMFCVKLNWKYVHVFLLTLGDMFTPENGENEPDWVTTEKKHFSEFRDMNKVCSGKEIYQHHPGVFPGYSFKVHDPCVFC